MQAGRQIKVYINYIVICCYWKIINFGVVTISSILLCFLGLLALDSLASLGYNHFPMFLSDTDTESLHEAHTHERGRGF